jgi:multiple sugar transport system substrate-binding protein
MRMKIVIRKTAWLPLIAMLLLVVAAGCGQGGNAGGGTAAGEGAVSSVTKPPQQAAAANPAPAPQEPVTVTLYMNGTEASFFNDTVAKIVKAQLPNITMKVIQPPGDFYEPLNNAIVSKEPLPDVIVASNGATSALVEMQVFSDLTPLMKEAKFDFNRIRPDLTGDIKSISNKGEILLMPYDVQTAVTFYNKDLFDKFGVAYPQNGLTWDSIVDLTAKLSRVDGGIRYRGYDMLTSINFNNPYSIPFYDPVKKASALDNPGWSKILGAAKKLYDVPNNFTEAAMLDKGRDYFVKDRTLAMFPIGFSFMQQSTDNKSADGMHWDMVSLPTYPDKPKLSSQPTYHYMAITPNSKVKQAAFQIMAMMMKDENVKAIARAAREPVIEINGVEQEFGKDLDLLKGKNVSAFFYNKFAPSASSSKYDAKIRAALIQAYRSMALDGVDVNTALRSAKEVADQAIRDMGN